MYRSILDIINKNIPTKNTGDEKNIPIVENHKLNIPVIIIFFTYKIYTDPYYLKNAIYKIS